MEDEPDTVQAAWSPSAGRAHGRQVLCFLCPACNYSESAPWFCKGTHSMAEEAAKRFVLSLSDLKEHIFTDGI